MISASFKQLIAWPIAFSLSAGFFLGGLELFSNLPSKANTDHHDSIHHVNQTDTTHRTEKIQVIDQTKPASAVKGTNTEGDHYVGDRAVNHSAKPNETRHPSTHGTKTH